MQLDDFVTETLKQIQRGIVKAQCDEGGEAINASPGSSIDLGGNLINCGEYGILSRVDFDVLVSAETSGSGEARLSVFGVGAQGGAGHKSSSANRISFSVTVRLPDGDKERAAAVDAERERRARSIPRHQGSWL